MIPVSTYEDALLNGLWRRRGESNWWLLEVPIGYADAPANSRQHRRIDAVVLAADQSRISAPLQDLDEFTEAVLDAKIEMIEAKKRLNVSVVGQLLAGASMFSARYPSHGPVTLTAVVEHDRDAALRWYCASVGIDVVEVDPDWDVAESSL